MPTLTPLPLDEILVERFHLGRVTLGGKRLGPLGRTDSEAAPEVSVGHGTIHGTLQGLRFLGSTSRPLTPCTIVSAGPPWR